MTAIRAADLFYLYRAAHGDVAALRGLTLVVEEGDVVAVLGPSGSGKTTLLGLCAGFHRPSSGELTVLGHDFAHASQLEISRLRRAAVGIVRQHYHRALPRELTVEEIVTLPLRLQGRRSRDDRGRVSNLIERAGLRSRKDARPNELSGGEQQRVAVCAALAKRPRLVLADEPTGELDARSTSIVVELLIELAADVGAAAVIVTHDPEVAVRSKRTIQIRDGRLAAEGTTSPVLIIDEQGWLRLPRRLRDEAGLAERVRARASSGKVELLAEEPRARGSVGTPRRLPARNGEQAPVALHHVAKRYGTENVLDALSWTFAAGRLHVVGGPSGSGKTTILNLIAALDHPDDGEVWLGGRRVDDVNATIAAQVRRELLGFVSQHSTLVEFLSAAENVELALSLRAVPEGDAADLVTSWLERVGLAKLADRRADRLSGGEQRRVALARALAPSPRVLLADEPTAHLDRMTGRQVIGLLRAAVDEGATVIAASHDPDLLASADTRLLLGGLEPRHRQSDE